VQVQGKNLFPLSHNSQYMNGYFMDGAGEVYSTKKGTLVRLDNGQHVVAKDANHPDRWR
jgi:hypothetical protein